LARTFRLIRLLKLKWILDMLNDMLDSEAASIITNVVKMLLLLLMINHYIACGWYWVATDRESHGETTWVSANSLSNASWDHLYILSFHWSITQFTPASMDLQPENLSERQFTLGVVVFALVGFSYVVGSISSSLAQLRGLSESWSKEFWKLRRFLKRHHVPLGLSFRIRRFLEYEQSKLEHKMPISSVTLLNSLSEQMMGELQFHMNIAHMTIHPMMNYLRMQHGLIAQRICLKAVSRKQLAHGDHLFVPGEYAEHIHFLVSGRLVYRKAGSSMQEWVDPGEDWITEPALWTAEWQHLGTLTASRESTVMSIDATNFGTVATANPAAAAFLSAYAAAFMDWIKELGDADLSDILQGELDSAAVADLVEAAKPPPEIKKGMQKLRKSRSSFFDES